MDELDLKSLIGEETVSEEPKKSSRKRNVKVEETVEDTVDKVESAMQTAAATAAVAAAIEANSKIALSQAEREYIIGKKKFMLNKCRTDRVVKFTGSKVYAQYFGRVYSFLYNTVPVTVRFDGTTQEFPEFVYNEIMRRIQAVSELSTPKSVNETR